MAKIQLNFRFVSWSLIAWKLRENGERRLDLVLSVQASGLEFLCYLTVVLESSSILLSCGARPPSLIGRQVIMSTVSSSHQLLRAWQLGYGIFRRKGYNLQRKAVLLAIS
jgi:hypothetical protein